MTALGIRRARVLPSNASLRLVGVLAALLIACVVGGLRTPDFLTVDNLLNVGRQNAVLALLAIGMTFVIIGGGIDLSVGSVLAFTSVIAVKLAGTGLLVTLLASLLVGATIGLINGLIIAKLKIAPFIATLTMLLALRGLTIAVFGEETVPLSAGRAAFLAFGRSTVVGLPVQLPIVACAFALAHLTLKYTRFGRSIYVLGGSEDSARLLGLQIDRIKIAVYTLSGALAGFAGALFAARIGAGITNYGLGLELDAITAVALGGTLLTGGVGNVGGTLAGVVLIGVLFNIFNLDATLNPFFQKVVRGLLLTMVVVGQGALSKRR